MKKVSALILNGLLCFNLIITSETYKANQQIVEDIFIKIENSDNISDGIEVYYNLESHEYSAVFDVSQYEIGETVVLYEDKEADIFVGVDILQQNRL
ncbi:MAG: hypothetical protein IKJ01_08785 [Lachnospiraceae bacterium]|nr:hypothetical protein [Lachnospiraceae bacterium]